MHDFQDVRVTLDEILLVQHAGVSPVPPECDTRILESACSLDNAGPFFTLYMHALKPAGIDQEGTMCAYDLGTITSMMPLSILAELAAAIDEAKDLIPADDRARFVAMVDQSRHSYRDGYKNRKTTT